MGRSAPVAEDRRSGAGAPAHRHPRSLSVNLATVPKMRSCDAHLAAAVDGAVGALSPAVDDDWSVPAGGVRWTCDRTARHVADDLVGYAGQLVTQVTDGYLPFRVVANPGTPPRGLLDLIEMGGVLLGLTVSEAPKWARAYHSYGIADAEGFAALGAAEVVLHTHDIATGLAVEYEPEAETCSWLLARLHRDLPEHDDPWQLLLWATGRTDLPGQTRVRRWRWYPAPAEDGGAAS